MTLNEFRDKMYRIDPMCEVTEHPTVACCIRIRPSNTEYRNRLIDAAMYYRPIGLLVSIVKEVDEFIGMEMPKKRNFFDRDLLKWMFK